MPFIWLSNIARLASASPRAFAARTSIEGKASTICIANCRTIKGPNTSATKIQKSIRLSRPYALKSRPNPRREIRPTEKSAISPLFRDSLSTARTGANRPTAPNWR